MTKPLTGTATLSATQARKTVARLKQLKSTTLTAALYSQSIDAVSERIAMVAEMIVDKIVEDCIAPSPGEARGQVQTAVQAGLTTLETALNEEAANAPVD